ncbi:MAG: hypothetical protein AAF251_07570 [Pseudomonadota bacterium]
MFGADTNLVFDALQMVAVAAAFTGGAVYLIMRRSRGKSETPVEPAAQPTGDLEERVRVLERIATDPATRLAEQFEALEKAENQGKEHAR